MAILFNFYLLLIATNSFVLSLDQKLSQSNRHRHRQRYVVYKTNSDNSDTTTTEQSALKTIKINQNDNTNIVTRLGQTVHLPCHLYKSVDQSSSTHAIWSKLSERHRAKVLTIGLQQLTFDMRFRLKVNTTNEQASNDNGYTSENWQLEIRKVSYEDAGVYQCSLPLKTPIYKNVTLRVEPELVMKPKQGFYNIDTPIHLSCSANLTIKDQMQLQTHKYSEHELINWYKDDKLIDLDLAKYKFNNRIDNVNELTSEFVIIQATYSDSATYTCKYENIVEKSLITIVNENAESFKYQSSNASHYKQNLLQTCLFILFICFKR